MFIVNAVNKSLVEIDKKKYAINSGNSQKKDSLGEITGIVCHWTAGDYDDFYDGYHYNIGVVQNNVAVIKVLGLNQKGQHVWSRNTGLIGITLCAMKDWVLLPTDEQLDMMSLLIAELCCWKKLDPKGKITLPLKKVVGDSITTIQGFKDFNVISDHREFSTSDGYGASRQDINNTKLGVDYMKLVRAKAIKYYNELKANKRKFVFVDIIK